MIANDDPELIHLQAMHRSALALCGSADPLLRGQYEGLLGRITALLTIKCGALPAAIDAVVGVSPSDRPQT